MGSESNDIREDGKVIRSVSTELPDREADEDPITKNQLRYIKKLASGIKVKGGLENLGKWQASALIDQIKEAQEDLEDDIHEGRTGGGSGGGRIVMVILGLLFVGYIASKFM